MFEVGHRGTGPPVEQRPRLPRLVSCATPDPFRTTLPRGHRVRIGRGGIARVQRQQVGASVMPARRSAASLIHALIRDPPQLEWIAPIGTSAVRRSACTM